MTSLGSCGHSLNSMFNLFESDFRLLVILIIPTMSTLGGRDCLFRQSQIRSGRRERPRFTPLLAQRALWFSDRSLPNAAPVYVHFSLFGLVSYQTWSYQLGTTVFCTLKITLLTSKLNDLNLSMKQMVDCIEQIPLSL